MQSNKLNFFVPVTFEKAGEKDQVMRVSGVCSTTAEDTDGEVLEPSGFDFTPLMQKGFFNYNHRGNVDAGAIIGEPTAARVIDGGKKFALEGFLYPNKQGKDTYDLGMTLEKHSKTRKLGWSIEGQVIERDPINPKRILKARITGVAITPSPKNPNTFVSLMKGEYNEAFVEYDDVLEKGEPDIQSLVEEYNAWTGNAKDSDMYGCEGDVYEFLQNNHEQWLGEVDIEDLRKNILSKTQKSISADPALTQESIDGVKKRPIVMDSPVLKKSDIYDSIISRYQLDDFEKAESIYNFTQQVHNKLNMQQVTEATMSKALDLLDQAINLEKGEQGEALQSGQEGGLNAQIDALEKGNDEDLKDKKPENKDAEGQGGGDDDEDEDDEMEKAVTATCSRMISKGKTRDQIVDKLVKGGMGLEQAAAACDKCIADANAHKDGGTITQVSPAIVKGIEDELNAKFDAKFDMLSKAMSTRFSAAAGIMRELQAENASLKEALQKSETEVGTLSGKLESALNVPAGRKSIVTARERFEKGGEQLEGSFIGGATTGQPVVLDINKADDMKALSGLLMNAATTQRNGGVVNNRLEKAVADLEVAKSTDFKAIDSDLKILNVSLINSYNK